MFTLLGYQDAVVAAADLIGDTSLLGGEYARGQAEVIRDVFLRPVGDEFLDSDHGRSKVLADIRHYINATTD